MRTTAFFLCSLVTGAKHKPPRYTKEYLFEENREAIARRKEPKKKKKKEGETDFPPVCFPMPKKERKVFYSFLLFTNSHFMFYFLQFETTYLKTLLFSPPFQTFF